MILVINTYKLVLELGYLYILHLFSTMIHIQQLKLKEKNWSWRQMAEMDYSLVAYVQVVYLVPVIDYWFPHLLLLLGLENRRLDYSLCLSFCTSICCLPSFYLSSSLFSLLMILLLNFMIILYIEKLWTSYRWLCTIKFLSEVRWLTHWKKQFDSQRTNILV